MQPRDSYQQPSSPLKDRPVSLFKCLLHVANRSMCPTIRDDPGVFMIFRWGTL